MQLKSGWFRLCHFSSLDETRAAAQQCATVPRAGGTTALVVSKLAGSSLLLMRLTCCGYRVAVTAGRRRDVSNWHQVQVGSGGQTKWLEANATSPISLFDHVPTLCAQMSGLKIELPCPWTTLRQASVLPGLAVYRVTLTPQRGLYSSVRPRCSGRKTPSRACAGYSSCSE